MKTYISLFLVAVGSVCSFSVLAQQEPQFTQSFDNLIHVNPAYAGSRGVLNFTDINRVQWSGFSGNPTSNTISMNSPIFNESLGAGLSVVTDKIGPMKQTMAFVDLAYAVKLNNKGAKLSFGLKGGFNLVNINIGELAGSDPNDPAFNQPVQNNFNANIGAGVFYRSEKLYAGISTPKILKQGYTPSANNIEKSHTYAIVGGIINLNTEWKLKPTAQVRFTQGSPLNMDLSAAGIYRDKLWLGAMYRVGAAYGVFAQMMLTPQLKLGVATDFDSGTVKKYNNGTYELLLTYDFNFKQAGSKSPRYF